MVDDGSEGERNARWYRGRRIVKDVRAEVVTRMTREGPAAGGHFVQDDAEGPYIRPDVCRFAAQLFGSHVGRRADDAAGASLACDHDARGFGRFGFNGFSREAEVEHLCTALGSQHHVRALQIAMDDAVRGRAREPR
jgi:hypothetical protein